MQSRLLGAETVTIVYRRGRERMGASRYEQDHAQQSGVRIIANATPVRVIGNGARARGRVRVHRGGAGGPARHRPDASGSRPTRCSTPSASGSAGVPAGLGISGGKIVVTGPGRTSLPGVWAGGDCATGGDDLTVTAVAEGRDAAEDIHATLTG